MTLRYTDGNRGHGGRLQWQFGSRKVRSQRATTIVVPVLMLVSEAVLAQEPGRAQPGQTPVGHRQPMQSTLPPAVRKEEVTTGRRPVDDLGPIPKICSNC
jgi:hypothetical protein